MMNNDPHPPNASIQPPPVGHPRAAERPRHRQAASERRILPDAVAPSSPPPARRREAAAPPTTRVSGGRRGPTRAAWARGRRGGEGRGGDRVDALIGLRLRDASERQRERERERAASERVGESEREYSCHQFTSKHTTRGSVWRVRPPPLSSIDHHTQYHQRLYEPLLSRVGAEERGKRRACPCARDIERERTSCNRVVGRRGAHRGTGGRSCERSAARSSGRGCRAAPREGRARRRRARAGGRSRNRI